MSESLKLVKLGSVPKPVMELELPDGSKKSARLTAIVEAVENLSDATKLTAVRDALRGVFDYPDLDLDEAIAIQQSAMGALEELAASKK